MHTVDFYIQYVIAFENRCSWSSMLVNQSTRHMSQRFGFCQASRPTLQANIISPICDNPQIM